MADLPMTAPTDKAREELARRIAEALRDRVRRHPIKADKTMEETILPHLREYDEGRAKDESVVYLQAKLTQATVRAEQAEAALKAVARGKTHNDSAETSCEYEQAGGPRCVRNDHYPPLSWDEYLAQQGEWNAALKAVERKHTILRSNMEGVKIERDQLRADRAAAREREQEAVRLLVEAKLVIADYEGLRDLAVALCERRGWSLNWTHRLAAHVLEVSELTEAIRGKKGDPLEETGDALFTLMALSPFSLQEVVPVVKAKVAKLMAAPPYRGEETVTDAPEPSRHAFVPCNVPGCGVCGVCRDCGKPASDPIHTRESEPDICPHGFPYMAHSCGKCEAAAARESEKPGGAR